MLGASVTRAAGDNNTAKAQKLTEERAKWLDRFLESHDKEAKELIKGQIARIDALVARLEGVSGLAPAFELSMALGNPATRLLVGLSSPLRPLVTMFLCLCGPTNPPFPLCTRPIMPRSFTMLAAARHLHRCCDGGCLSTRSRWCVLLHTAVSAGCGRCCCGCGDPATPHRVFGCAVALTPPRSCCCR